MTAPDRDPVTLARDVLDMAAADPDDFGCIDQETWLGMQAPDLARAVIDLTAKRGTLVEQMERLAVELECEASPPGYLRATGGFDRAHVAARIRVALNGGDA